MGLIILLVIGGLLGWLAAICQNSTTRPDQMANIALGMAGALGAGVLSYNGSVLAGISAFALLMGFVGGAATLIFVLALRGQLVK